MSGSYIVVKTVNRKTGKVSYDVVQSTHAATAGTGKSRQAAQKEAQQKAQAEEQTSTSPSVPRTTTTTSRDEPAKNYLESDSYQEYVKRQQEKSEPEPEKPLPTGRYTVQTGTVPFQTREKQMQQEWEPTEYADQYPGVRQSVPVATRTVYKEVRRPMEDPVVVATGTETMYRVWQPQPPEAQDKIAEMPASRVINKFQTRVKEETEKPFVVRGPDDPQRYDYQEPSVLRQVLEQVPVAGQLGPVIASTPAERAYLQQEAPVAREFSAFVSGVKLTMTGRGAEVQTIQTTHPSVRRAAETGVLVSAVGTAWGWGQLAGGTPGVASVKYYAAKAGFGAGKPVQAFVATHPKVAAVAVPSYQAGRTVFGGYVTYSITKSLVTAESPIDFATKAFVIGGTMGAFSVVGKPFISGFDKALEPSLAKYGLFKAPSLAQARDIKVDARTVKTTEIIRATASGIDTSTMRVVEVYGTTPPKGIIAQGPIFQKTTVGSATITRATSPGMDYRFVQTRTPKGTEVVAWRRTGRFLDVFQGKDYDGVVLGRQTTYQMFDGTFKPIGSVIFDATPSASMPTLANTVETAFNLRYAGVVDKGKTAFQRTKIVQQVTGAEVKPLTIGEQVSRQLVMKQVSQASVEMKTRPGILTGADYAYGENLKLIMISPEVYQEIMPSFRFATKPMKVLPRGYRVPITAKDMLPIYGEEFATPIPRTFYNIDRVAVPSYAPVTTRQVFTDTATFKYQAVPQPRQQPFIFGDPTGAVAVGQLSTQILPKPISVSQPAPTRLDPSFIQFGLIDSMVKPSAVGTSLFVAPVLGTRTETEVRTGMATYSRTQPSLRSDMIFTTQQDFLMDVAQDTPTAVRQRINVGQIPAQRQAFRTSLAQTQITTPRQNYDFVTSPAPTPDPVPEFRITPPPPPPLSPPSPPPWTFRRMPRSPSFSIPKIHTKRDFGKYAPSAVALAENIRGKRPKLKRFTGFELRPIDW
jgi:hypothetical protein